ncbi:putative MO25-like protein [Hordeum vulgare]|nr:putative MO25-like protein [Hordeum vulgare]
MSSQSSTLMSRLGIVASACRPRDGKEVASVDLYDQPPRGPQPIRRNVNPYADDPDYNAFMEKDIFEGHGQAFHAEGQDQAYDPDATQSQNGRGQDGVDEKEEADNHGNSWHEDEKEEGVDIAEGPLFIDELAQRAEAQRRKQSIRTGSSSKDEDT